MTNRDLFEAIGAIDEDLVLAADKPPVRPKRSWRPVLLRAVPAAACLCLIAGTVLWQLRGGLSGKGATPDTATAAAPEEAAREAIPNQAAGGDGGAQAKTYNNAPAIYNESGATLSAFPAELADLLDTGSDVYTMSVSPAVPDRTKDSDWTLPETVPVYASMASARSIDTGGMRSRLETMLQALGLDPALAEDAVYTGLTQEEAEAQADTLREQGGSKGDELRLWADAGLLTLDVAPCGKWPQGLHITVDCEGTVCTEVPDREAMVLILPLHAYENIDIVRSNMPEIAALAGKDPIGQEYFGTDYNWHIRFYDADDASTRGIEAGDLRSVEIELDEDGNLCKVIWRAPDLLEPVGEYATITREEADELMAQNIFLTDVGTLDGSSVLEYLDSVRLVYTNHRVGAWYLPYWSYIADEGTDEADPFLHVYREYLVPAVRLQDLEAMADAQ